MFFQKEASFSGILGWIKTNYIFIINRPGVAGDVLQIPLLLIIYLIHSSFGKISSNHCLSQTVRAWEAKFWENVYSQPCVTCQVSYVRCQVSGVKFPKHPPSGPMLSMSQNVRLNVHPCICPSVRVFTFEVPFKHLFAPTSRSRMSNIFRDSKSLGKSNGKKWSQIWTFWLESCLKLPGNKSLFFCWFCLTKHGRNHASRWIKDLWSKGISLILAYL